MTTDTWLQIQQATAFIQSHSTLKPKAAIILGTGLGGLVDDMDIRLSMRYCDIPYFPTATVESHEGRLLMGYVSKIPVVIMQGRFHYYEGYPMQAVTFPVRVMRMLGATALFSSNAAGGLDPAHELSDLMLIEDHINLFPENPLTGPNLDKLGVRFPDMSQPYSRNLQKLALSVAQRLDLHLHKGVYVGLPGPNLETPAEYRYLRIIGADAVGMSTVPEVIVARHMRMEVFAVSVITDLCTPEKLRPMTIEEVIEAAQKAEPKLLALFREMLPLWSLGQG
ncbi:MAG: purine-nucleoside phosphorylase [Bernardetiaceae bacterium]